MVSRISRTSIEICILTCCILVIAFTAMQIITLGGKPVSSKEMSVPLGGRSVKQTKKTESPARRNRLAMAQARLRLRARAQLEIRALEKSLSRLLREKAPTPEESSRTIQTQVYGRRILNIIHKAESGGLTPVHVNSSRLRQAQIRMRRSHAASSQALNSSSSTTSGAQKYGIPLMFESIHSAQQVVDLTSRRNPDFVKHFKDLDKQEEGELSNILQEAKNFGESNFSADYEENFVKIKKQFQDGTELFVDEDLLRKQSKSGYDVCPTIPESLVGNTTEITLNITLDIEDVVYNNSDVGEGGEWKPSTCVSRHRVAIIIPYRDRWTHLKLLLFYLIPTLKRQQIHFRIFVVEQFGNETFNKGRIMNAAFKEAVKLFDFHCVTFHDVDLVPEDDRNLYSCTEQPKHMSHSIDKFQYILPYQGLVGGVLMFRREHFQLVNGYSNMYWGWGAEDDDMTTRILYRGLRIYRPPITIAKYKMVKHEGRKTSEVAVRMKLLRTAAKRSKLEGLNNIKYQLLFTHTEKLFTHFKVDIGLP